MYQLSVGWDERMVKRNWMTPIWRQYRWTVLKKLRKPTEDSRFPSRNVTQTRSDCVNPLNTYVFCCQRITDCEPGFESHLRWRSELGVHREKCSPWLWGTAATKRWYYRNIIWQLSHVRFLHQWRTGAKCTRNQVTVLWCKTRSTATLICGVFLTIIITLWYFSSKGKIVFFNRNAAEFPVWMHFYIRIINNSFKSFIISVKFLFNPLS